MTRIVSFTDTPALNDWIAQSVDSQHMLWQLTASQLTHGLREELCDYMPDVILLELSATLNNAFLYFFLRSDQTMRHIPIILVSDSTLPDLYAHVFECEDYVQRFFAAHRLSEVIERHFPLELTAGMIAA